MKFPNEQGARRVLISVFTAASLALSAAAIAQEEEESAAAQPTDESAELDRVTVTGSRIKRSDIEGPAPVIIIDQDQMAERGYVTVFEALEDMTINSGFKFESPEFSNGFTPDVQTLNLRGFGVGQTLVLINGRRLANYPAAYQSDTTVFNFGAIPISAVERIEILATGASAIYGSDAVAGVVNLILRKDVQETVVNLLYGTPTETKSNRDDVRVQLLTGKTFENGSFSLALEYQKRDSILGGDFDQYDEEADYPYGTGILDRDILTLDWWKAFFGTGFTTDPPFQSTPRYRDPGDILGTSGDAACALSGSGNTYFERPNAGYACGFDGVSLRNFRNEKEANSLFLNGYYAINNNLELFVDVLYYSSESVNVSRGYYVFEDILDLTTPDSNGIGAAFFGLPYDWYLAQRRFNSLDTGMNMDANFEDEAMTFSVGLRGSIGFDHDWEVVLNQSDYTYDYFQPWLKYQEVIDNMLGTFLGFGLTGVEWWSGGTLGEGLPFGLGDPQNLYGPCNQACRDVFDMQTYGNETSSSSLLFTIQGDIMEMEYGPLSYAAVFEYEDQDFEFIPDELIQQSPPLPGLVGSGWYKLTGYQGKGDRQRYALGGELRIPLFRSLTVNLAARFDDYDSGSTSFGSDITPSASIEWRPVDKLLVRSGYSASFRAPDMAQVFVSTGFFTGAVDLVQCYELYIFQNGTDEGFNQNDCDAVSVFVERVGSQSLGENALDAETGYSQWLGFVWDVTDNLYVSVDYSKIRLEDRVTLESLSNILEEEFACYRGDATGSACDRADNRLDRQVDPTTGISFITRFNATPINQFEEEIESIDARLFYSKLTDVGRFRVVAEYSNMLSHTRRDAPGEPEINLRDDPILGGWDFRSSLTLSLTYSNDKFATTLTGFRRGTTTVWGCFSVITDENRCTNGRHRIPSYKTFNWSASYDFTRDLQARLRVVNLTDEEPPYDDTFSAFSDPWYNYFVYPGAGIGRTAALEVEYRF